MNTLYFILSGVVAYLTSYIYIYKARIGRERKGMRSFLCYLLKNKRPSTTIFKELRGSYVHFI